MKDGGKKEEKEEEEDDIWGTARKRKLLNTQRGPIENPDEVWEVVKHLLFYNMNLDELERIKADCCVPAEVLADAIAFQESLRQVVEAKEDEEVEEGKKKPIKRRRRHGKKKKKKKPGCPRDALEDSMLSPRQKKDAIQRKPARFCLEMRPDDSPLKHFSFGGSDLVIVNTGNNDSDPYCSDGLLLAIQLPSNKKKKKKKKAEEEATEPQVKRLKVDEDENEESEEEEEVQMDLADFRKEVDWVDHQILKELHIAPDQGKRVVMWKEKRVPSITPELFTQYYPCMASDRMSDYYRFTADSSICATRYEVKVFLTHLQKVKRHSVPPTLTYFSP